MENDAYVQSQIEGMRNSKSFGLKSAKPKYELLKDLPDAPKGTIIEPKGMNEKDGYRHLLFTEEYMERTPEWFRRVSEQTLESAVSKALYCWSNNGAMKIEEAMSNLRKVYEATKK